jgi:hypothetical protein
MAEHGESEISNLNKNQSSVIEMGKKKTVV